MKALLRKAFLRIDYRINLPWRKEVKTWMGEIQLGNDLDIVKAGDLYENVFDNDIHVMYVPDERGYSYKFVMTDVDGYWRALNDRWWNGNSCYKMSPRKFCETYLPTFPKRHWYNAAIETMYFQLM